MEEYSAPSLESLFNGPSVTSEPAPTAEPAPASEPVATDPTGEPNPAPPAEETEDPKISAFKAKAIDEGKKRQKLEQDNAELQRQNAEFQRQMQQFEAQQRQQAQQVERPQPLSPHDFNSHDDYLVALAEERASAKAQEIFDLNMRRAMDERQQEATQKQTQADIADMISAGKGKYADFQQVAMGSHIPVTETMLHAMLAIDAGHDVGYYLGQNPAEASRISQLPPSSQSREIGRIAREFIAKIAPPPPPVAQVQPVHAPAPELPKTLTQTRSAGGQFTKAWTGPTPLDQIVKRK